jgi:hypothetical protein
MLAKLERAGLPDEGDHCVGQMVVLARSAPAARVTTACGGRRRRWIATTVSGSGGAYRRRDSGGSTVWSGSQIGTRDHDPSPAGTGRYTVEQPHRSGIWRVWDGAKVRPRRASRDGAGLASFETALSLNAELEAPAS